MNSRLLIACTALSIALTACATPPEVKQLSLKQMGYFDAAIEAVSLQSEALILAVEKLVSYANANIDSIEKQSWARFETLIQGELSQGTAERALEEVSETTEKALANRAKLDSDLSDIKQKTEELKAYLRKMKEVHQALDAYVQSEKAGERVVNDVLNHPSVSALLETADELIPKVEGGIKEVKALLNNM